VGRSVAVRRFQQVADLAASGEEQAFFPRMTEDELIKLILDLERRKKQADAVLFKHFSARCIERQTRQQQYCNCLILFV
jgi:hypothetical protein